MVVMVVLAVVVVLYYYLCSAYIKRAGYVLELSTSDRLTGGGMNEDVRKDLKGQKHTFMVTTASPQPTTVLPKSANVSLKAATLSLKPTVLLEPATVAVKPTLPPLKRRGYVLELNTSDQLTGGAMNVMTLQCLAGKLGADHSVVAVEPFEISATFGALLFGDHDAFARANSIRMSDVYDLEQWHAYTDQKHYPRLATWEDFVLNAPRDLILVENQWWQECNLEARENEFQPFFDAHSFRVVRKVCSHFKHSGWLTFEQYTQAIYGNYTTESVTVIITRFPGINNVPGQVHAWSTVVSGTGCDKWGHISDEVLQIRPGKKLIQTADRYIEKYLGGKDSYITVMVRLEIAATVQTKTGESNNLKAVDVCLNQLITAMEHLEKRSNGKQFDSLFLTLDTGKYGSYSMISRENAAETDLKVRKFFLRVQRSNMTYEEWEGSFEEVLGLRGSAGTAGFVAMLQKEIARRGCCIVQAGGGTFQASTFNLYKSTHSGMKLCYSKLNELCEFGGSEP